MRKYDFLSWILVDEFRPLLRQLVDGCLDYPAGVELDLTTDCNFNCPDCIDRSRPPHHTLSKSLLVELLDDFEQIGIRNVILIGGGEPLCSPHLPFALEKCSACGIKAAVVTNGSLVSDTIAEAMAENCSWVRFSLNAGEARTHDLIHRPRMNDVFNTVLRNLERLSGLMPGRTGVSFVVEDANAAEVVQAARLARNTGCSHIQFKAKRDPATKALLPLRKTEAVSANCAAAQELSDKEFKVHLTLSLRAVLALDRSQPKEYDRCSVQRIRTTICADGTVFPCSLFRHDATCCLGNVRTARLPDLWHSPEVRARLEDWRASQRCAGVFCIAHKVNQAIDLLCKAHSRGIPFLDYLVETPGRSDLFL